MKNCAVGAGHNENIQQKCLSKEDEALIKVGVMPGILWFRVAFESVTIRLKIQTRNWLGSRTPGMVFVESQVRAMKKQKDRG